MVVANSSESSSKDKLNHDCNIAIELIKLVQRDIVHLEQRSHRQKKTSYMYLPLLNIRALYHEWLRGEWSSHET